MYKAIWDDQRFMEMFHMAFINYEGRNIKPIKSSYLYVDADDYVNETINQ